MMPKASYYDVVLNCKDLVSMSVIAKDYSWSAILRVEVLDERLDTGALLLFKTEAISN